MSRPFHRSLAEVLLALCVSVPGAAKAFSDPELFAQPAERGGGGGRFFTGSPADGQACSVCHRGGVEPVLGVAGLPAEFEVGTSYDVTVRWAHPEIAHGLQLELLTDTSESPLVELPALESLSTGARCESSAEGDPAVYLTAIDKRRIVGVRDCGASELSFRFVAPSARRIAFSASVVRSDSSGTAEGDGALDLRHVIYARGQAPAAGGCAVASARRGSDLFSVLVVLIVLSAARRRRSKGLAARCQAAAGQSAKTTCYALITLLSAGCYQPDRSADYVPAASIRVDAAVRAPLDASASTLMDASALAALDAQVVVADAQSALPSALTFRVLTAPVGGRYVPRNIGAIWIEREDGVFVKTLARWALTRAMYLRRFNTASAVDVTDAITSATLELHEQHEVRWNLTDRGGAEVARGGYRLVVELTDRDSRGLSLEVPFELGSEAQLLRPVATPQFKDMELVLQ